MVFLLLFITIKKHINIAPPMQTPPVSPDTLYQYIQQDPEPLSSSSVLLLPFTISVSLIRLSPACYGRVGSFAYASATSQTLLQSIPHSSRNDDMYSSTVEGSTGV